MAWASRLLSWMGSHVGSGSSSSPQPAPQARTNNWSRWGSHVGAAPPPPPKPPPPPPAKPRVPGRRTAAPRTFALPKNYDRQSNSPEEAPRPEPGPRRMTEPLTAFGRFVNGPPGPEAPSQPRKLIDPLTSLGRFINNTPEPPPPKTPLPSPTGPPPEVSDGVRKILNDRNWKLPEKHKRAEMPKSSFDKKGVTDLKEHDYLISDEEWTRLKTTYSGEKAAKAGYVAPKAMSDKVEKNRPMMKLGEQESAALTWEAYEDLSKGQRAAIDFNTLLVDAREDDLRKKINLHGVKRTDYDKRVTDMFGAAGGSDTVATHTVDLLSKLDMKVVGQDLDEYLSLERSIDTTELKDFKFSKDDIQTLDTLANGPTSQTPEQAFAAVRTPENLAAVDTEGVKNAQTMIQKALQTPGATTYDFNTLVNGPDEGLPPMGFGTTDTKWKDPTDANKNQWFQDSLAALSAADPTQVNSRIPAGVDPMSWLLADLDAATQNDPVQRQEFLDYIANITQLGGQYGTKEDAEMAALINKRAGLGG